MELSVQPELLLLAGLFFALDRGAQLAPCLLAAGVHELGHALAVVLCRGRILRLSLGASGARMETTPLSYRQEVLCALAGPLAGLSLLLVRRYAPWLALWGLMQSLYNLLPVYPLDGGRALRALLLLHLPLERGEALSQLVSRCTLALAAGTAAYASFGLRLGLLPLALAGTLILRAVRAK